MTELTEAQVAAELAANEKAIAKFAEQIAAQKSPAEATADAAAKAAADAAEAAKAAAAASTPAAVNIETTIGPYGLTARELEGARDSLQEFGFSRDEIAAIEKGLPPVTPRFKRDVEIRYKQLSRDSCSRIRRR